MPYEDFPGSTVDGHPPTNAGDMGWRRVREDPTCHGATKPWTITAEPKCCNYGSLYALAPMLCNRRGHCREKPMLHNWGVASTLHSYRKKPLYSNKDPVQPKKKNSHINRIIQYFWVFGVWLLLLGKMNLRFTTVYIIHTLPQKERFIHFVEWINRSVLLITD